MVGAESSRPSQRGEWPVRHNAGPLFAPLEITMSFPKHLTSIRAKLEVGPPYLDPKLKLTETKCNHQTITGKPAETRLVILVHETTASPIKKQARLQTTTPTPT